MILIDAIYIHKSGGKVLLELLMKYIYTNGKQRSVIFLIDKRFESNQLNNYDKSQVLFLDSSETARKRFYESLPLIIKSIFCFANVPPPVRINNISVGIYFHNALILNSVGVNYGLKDKLYFFLKRYYIRYKNSGLYYWIVQTPSMAKLLSEKLSIKSYKIKVHPFFKDQRIRHLNNQLKINRNKFLYVADGVQQKNHENLLNAWKIIADSNDYNLELHLTIPSSFTYLVKIIEKLNSDGCVIINHGISSEQDLQKLYSTCNYLVFPSLAESFGLPLIEAANAGCEIIASDLPYVYDVIKPFAVFDPHNVQSIVNTILYVVSHPEKRGTGITIKNEIDKLWSTINRGDVQK